MNGFSLSVEAVGWLVVAVAIAVGAVWVGMRRRVAVRLSTGVMVGVGMMLLALAAGGVVWHRPASGEVVVMVDLSASTRGAGYREAAKLAARVKELLGETPYRVVYFSDHNVVAGPGGETTLGDLAGDRTVFAPPAGAAAVVLFSDGRFESPAGGGSVPVYAVADSDLDRSDDAAVTRLEMRGNDVAATVRNDGAGARRLTLDGGAAATQPAAVEIETGATTLTRPVRSGAAVASARLSKGDRWPENDGLVLPLGGMRRAERWFVSAGGAASPGGEWRTMTAEGLPTDAAAYLAPSVIVLENVPASALSGAQLRGLEQYVRDLGGALIIAGGDRAFAGGGYEGTALGALSPLASSPPTPSVHWILLADASGSMSQAVGETTRWQIAASSIARLLPNLPPEDPVSVGSFSGELRWWSTGRSARETAAMSLPPADVSPNGPTNLAAALARVAREAASGGGLPGELLVVSDADVEIDRPGDLAAQLREKRIRLHVLAIGEGRGLDALAAMTKATGGTLRRQLDPARWAEETRELLSGAWPDRFSRTPAGVTFTGDLASLPGRRVEAWNRTWLKSGAAQLGVGTMRDKETVAMVARWANGNGAVVATAFAPTARELSAMAARIARPPRDPRFTVGWDAGAKLRVRVDAGQRGQYLNGLRLTLELSPADGGGKGETYSIPQTAPGRYELSTPAPRGGTFATVRNGTTLVDRTAVAGRYAEEFDAIGNDYDALRALAARTGGQLIDAAWRRPIEVKFPTRGVELARWLALAGAVMVGAGLVRWRVGD